MADDAVEGASTGGEWVAALDEASNSSTPVTSAVSAARCLPFFLFFLRALFSSPASSLARSVRSFSKGSTKDTLNFGVIGWV